ncbi:hypothetical protein RDABS01_019698 [Bienertia sinuspersici]
MKSILRFPRQKDK